LFDFEKNRVSVKAFGIKCSEGFFKKFKAIVGINTLITTYQIDNPGTGA